YARNLGRAQGVQRSEARQQLRFAEDGRNTRTMFYELLVMGESVRDLRDQEQFHRFMGEDLEAEQAHNQWILKRAERAQKLKEFAEFQRQLYRARATDRRSAIIDVARALGGESLAVLQEEVDHLMASERELRRDAEAYRREGDELRYEQTMNEVAAIIAQRANKQRELRNFLRDHAAAQSNLTMAIVNHSRDIAAIAQAEYREAARVLNDMLLHPE